MLSPSVPVSELAVRPKALMVGMVASLSEGQVARGDDAAFVLHRQMQHVRALRQRAAGEGIDLGLAEAEAAIAAATTASTLDTKYEDGPLALGLAQIAAGQKAQGVASLKRGLLLMSDQARADQLIAENLEPNA